MSLSQLPERLSSRLEMSPEGCWLWTGCVNNGGYGTVSWEGSTWVVHRLVFTLLDTPIPEGLTLDHLCQARRCARPLHLEVTTYRENNRRGTSRSARNARKTHCKHGHEFTEENTYVDPRGRRYCRTCAKRLDRERYYSRRRAEHLRVSHAADGAPSARSPSDHSS